MYTYTLVYKYSFILLENTSHMQPTPPYLPTTSATSASHSLQKPALTGKRGHTKVVTHPVQHSLAEPVPHHLTVDTTADRRVQTTTVYFKKGNFDSVVHLSILLMRQQNTKRGNFKEREREPENLVNGGVWLSTLVATSQIKEATENIVKEE